MIKIVDLVKDVLTEEVDHGIAINGISYDSRKTKPGDLFFALEGDFFDGNEYIEEAENKGAVAIITSKKKTNGISIPILKVNDARIAMSKIASRYNNNPSEKINVIGVTGTNGKTTIVKMIEYILNDNNILSGSLGTLGFSSPSGIVSTGFTTPESVELHQMMKVLLDSKIYNCVMEVSSHSLEMHRVDDVKYNMAVFTNLSQDHLDFHKDMKKYFRAKEKLFKMLDSDSLAIINIDDNVSKALIKTCNCEVNTYGYSSQADVRIINDEYSFESTNAEISVFGKKYTLKTNLFGKYNLYNVVASIACLYKLIKVEDIIRSLTSFKEVPGRANKFFYKNKKIIVDYAHSPDAFEKIIKTVKEIQKNDSSKIIVVYGCGGDRDKEKRSKIGQIVDTLASYSIICDDNPRNEDPNNIIKSISDGYFSNRYKVIRDRKEAIKMGIDMLDANDILLVLGKGVEETQEVQGKISPHSDTNTITEYLNEI